MVKNNQHVPDGMIAVGIPVKVIGKVTKKQKDYYGYGKSLYIEMAHRYIAPGAFKRIEKSEAHT